MVYHVAYRILLDREEALDTVQETFCKAFQNIDRFDGDHRWRAWLRTIGVRTAISKTRKSSRMFRWLGRKVGDKAFLYVAGENEFAVDVLESRELLEMFHNALKELSPKQRSVAMLHLEQELSLSEVAAIMDIPLNTVKVHLHRARKHLRKRLSVFFPQE